MRRYVGIAAIQLLAACATYHGTAVVVEAPSAQRGLVLADGVTFERQGGSSDCGPTALRMAMRRLGCDLPPELQIPMVDGGATMQALRDAARANGCEAFVVRGRMDDFRDQLAKGRSLVVGLHKPFSDGLHAHYELVVGWHERERYLVTADPARGFTRIDEVGFLAEWEPAGCPLLLIARAP
jgi:hypothetical protein